jgi:hypothetical protein
LIECPKCKWSNQDDAVRCANCSAELRAPQPPPQQPPQQPPPGGQQYPPQQYGQPPYQQPGYAQYAQSVPDNLIWSILVTIFCCLPLGIVAIVKASEANSKKAMGDYQGAMAAYNASRTWTYWAAGLGVVQVLLGVLWGVFGAATRMHGMP